MSQLIDQPDLKAIAEGDAQAFAKLVDMHKNLVFTVALRMVKNKEEAEEVAQDTFIKVFKSLKKFKGECKLSTWIYRIAYNTCLDSIKKHKRMQGAVPVSALTGMELAVVNTALTALEHKEKSVVIEKCMQQLSAKDAGLVTLFYFEEKKLSEMAVLLDVAENTVKVQLFRARARLAKLLKEQMELGMIENYGK